MSRNESGLKANIESVWSRNWPTLIGIFCVPYIWASIASAAAHRMTIVNDPGAWGYLGVAVGAAIALIVFVPLLFKGDGRRWLKCESILPSLCATLLVTSWFFFDWQNAASSFVANSILGFASASMIVLAVKGVRSELPDSKSTVAVMSVMLAMYAAFFGAVFLAWPLGGDAIGEPVGSAMLVVFLFVVIAGMSARMKKFDVGETQEGMTADASGGTFGNGSSSDSAIDLIPSLAEGYSLSPRETEVLTLLAQGFSAPYIADALYISNGTVKTHVTRIYRKLGVSKRDELMRLLRERT